MIETRSSPRGAAARGGPVSDSPEEAGAGPARGRHRPPSAPSRVGSTIRVCLGVVGELCLTAGAIVALYLVWELGFVAVVEGQRQADEVARLEQSFAAAAPPGAAEPTPDSTADPSPAPTSPSESAGSGSGTRGTTTGAEGASPEQHAGATGILRIPRLGSGWAKPVYEGVTPDVLARGLGHYPRTAVAGRVGNVALAGHRSGHGNPLIDIDAVRIGDRLVLETADGWHVYRAARTDVVTPNRSDVVAPVPEHPGVAPTERWLTVTTCHPRFGNSHRYVVFAQLERSFSRAEGVPASWLAEPGGS